MNYSDEKESRLYRGRMGDRRSVRPVIRQSRRSVICRFDSVKLAESELTDDGAKRVGALRRCGLLSVFRGLSDTRGPRWAA